VTDYELVRQTEVRFPEQRRDSVTNVECVYSSNATVFTGTIYLC
jgi:hypothetical protein